MSSTLMVTNKRRVAGSSPAGCTNVIKKRQESLALFCVLGLLCRVDNGGEVGGFEGGASDQATINVRLAE